MLPMGNQFGFVGGVSWLVILLTLVFLFFILITVCAKKDSWVRAIAYTAVLAVLFVYMMWWHLVPEIQKFHNLVPGDCLIAGPPVLVNYTYPHGHMIVVAHIPVNVSNIECHGEIGHGMDMTDIQGMKHFDARKDVIFCKEGESLANESTAYLKIDNWRWLDPDEREDAIDKYKEGENFFCWVDPEKPGFVTFTNDQDWSAIFYPLACIILIIFLCWAAGSFALCSACYYCCLTDPWFLRIDASTPVSELNRRRKGEYDHVI